MSEFSNLNKQQCDIIQAMKFKIHSMSLSDCHDLVLNYDGGFVLSVLCFLKQVFYPRNHQHQLSQLIEGGGRLPTFSPNCGQQVLNELISYGSWSQNTNSVAGRAAERLGNDDWTAVFIATKVRFQVQINRWKNEWGWQGAL